MKKLLVLIGLSTLLFGSSNNTKLEIGNFSVGLVKKTKQCYEMNNVDAFYVYKLYKQNKITVTDLEKAKGGTIVKATETFEGEVMDYTFFDSVKTCEKNKI